MRSRSPHLVPVAALTALTVLVFGVTLGAGFVWDDDVLIKSNARLRGDGAWTRALTDDFWATTVQADTVHGFWRPVVKLSHVALAPLEAPWPFHLLNLVLHLGAVLLAYRWLWARLTRSGLLDEDALRPALLGAALFSLHPSRYAVVGWISCSTDLFMSVFALLALWAFERRRYVAGALLVALAMFSKESIVALPLALLADGLLERRLDGRALTASVVGLVVPLALRAALGLSAPGIAFSAPGLTLVRTLATTGVYHARTVWPWPLTVLPYEPGSGGPLEKYGTGWFIAGVVAVTAWLAWAAAARKTSTARALLGDGAWWAALLTPFLQLVPVTSLTFASDRFLYLPLLGLSAVLARALALRPRALALGGAATFVAVGAVSLALALPAWDSGLTFFGREYRLHPDSEIIGTAFAGQLQLNGKHEALPPLLQRLASQRRSVKMANWAVVQLANNALARSHEPDRPTLEALARFYDGLLGGQPVPLVLADARYEAPGPPDALTRMARMGAFDDVEQFRARVALELGDLEDAARRGALLRAQPTPRRLRLLARIGAARGDFAAALRDASAAKGTASTPLVEALRTAASLARPGTEPCTAATPCSSEERALRRSWVDVWSALELRAQEDSALALLGDDPAALTLRLRALTDRHRDDEVRALLDAGALPGPAGQQLRDALEARRVELETERALTAAEVR